MDETVGEEDDEVMLEQQISPANQHQGVPEHNKKEELNLADLQSPVVENQQSNSAAVSSDSYPHPVQPIRLPAATTAAEMPPPIRREPPTEQTIISDLPRSTAPPAPAPSPSVAAPETNNDADETERQTLLQAYQGAKVCTLRMKEAYRPASVEIQAIRHSSRYRKTGHRQCTAHHRA